MHFLLLLVRLQQDWNAAKNNPSLLIDYPWEKFLQKMILHYISLPIYPLHFPKFCLIQKQ